MVELAMRQANNNQTHAARLLDISRDALRYKLRNSNSFLRATRTVCRASLHKIRLANRILYQRFPDYPWFVASRMLALVRSADYEFALSE